MNVNDTYTLSHIVTENETADKIGSGALPVYSTPSMIALMEKTAFDYAASKGHQSVGTKVDISHLRACKAGTQLQSTAKVVEIEGRRILFAVSVSDEKGLIGEGIHERFVIDPERFMAKLG